MNLHINPLETSELLEIELMNPNPTSSKTKLGPVYRVSFEVHRDAWDCFMFTETAGMVLEGSVRVTARNEPLKPPEKPDRPKGGPISRDAAMFCTDELANQYARSEGHTDLKSMIYELGDISSRAELDHDKTAAAVYERIKSDFIEWADL